MDDLDKFIADYEQEKRVSDICDRVWSNMSRARAMDAAKNVPTGSRAVDAIWKRSKPLVMCKDGKLRTAKQARTMEICSCKH
jgi:hypothetical protein